MPKPTDLSSVSSRGLLQLVYYQSMGAYRLVDKAIPLEDAVQVLK